MASACATAPQPPPSPAAGARVVAVLPPAPVVMSVLVRQGQPNAPTLGEVESRLGAADVARREAAGALLTYRLDTCGLVLLFEADGSNLLRLRAAAPGPRRAGDAVPSLETCAAELEARRAGAPVS